MSNKEIATAEVMTNDANNEPKTSYTDAEMAEIIAKAEQNNAPEYQHPGVVGPVPTKKKPKLGVPETYELDIDLPSKGLVYDNIPGTIRIRAMTTEDEKIIFASNSGNVMQRVLSKCIVYPEKIDVSQLISADEQYIMIKLREFTYGSDYHITTKCPYCGTESEYKIDLSSFDVKYLPDDFKEPLEMTLPISKNTLEVRMLRNKDYTSIREIAQKRARRSVKSTVSELEYILRMTRYIKSVNGVDARDMNIQSFVEKLHARDSAYFWAFINNKFDCGLDTSTPITCSSCGQIFDLPFEINSEFFRPKFEF